MNGCTTINARDCTSSWRHSETNNADKWNVCQILSLRKADKEIKPNLSLLPPRKNDDALDSSQQYEASEKALVQEYEIFHHLVDWIVGECCRENSAKAWQFRSRSIRWAQTNQDIWYIGKTSVLRMVSIVSECIARQRHRSTYQRTTNVTTFYETPVLISEERPAARVYE